MNNNPYDKRREVVKNSRSDKRKPVSLSLSLSLSLKGYDTTYFESIDDDDDVDDDDDDDDESIGDDVDDW